MTAGSIRRSASGASSPEALPARATIFANSSGRAPAAIAVIRVSGPAAVDALAALCGDVPEPRRAAVRRLTAADGSLLDETIVVRFAAPASATGEDIIELHCHGGRAVVDAVCKALAALPGLRPAEPGEFTRRALENGRLDLTEAEGLADLLAAETESQRRSAVAVAGGAIRRQVEEWTQRLVSLSARAEAAIDYVGDEDETYADIDSLAAEARGLRDELMEWLARPRAEPLREGIRVVLAGPPNAGKSSLLNALAGEDKAIVTPVAGTTRDVIEVPVAASGVPFILVDTAGLRQSSDVVERIGVERAQGHVRAADILLWLGDADQAPEHPNLLLLHPRADLPGRGAGAAGSLPVSALTGEGLEELWSELIARARQLLPAEGAAALNRRQAEAIAEAAEWLGHVSPDLVLTAEALRGARAALHRVTGRAGMEDVLDALFGRFCLGK